MLTPKQVGCAACLQELDSVCVAGKNCEDACSVWIGVYVIGEDAGCPTLSTGVVQELCVSAGGEQSRHSLM
eukprot:scaffold44290_cov19-Tisochrysis_lutea.AAC.1